MKLTYEVTIKKITDNNGYSIIIQGAIIERLMCAGVKIGDIEVVEK
jgi:hypothetical protein